jgi:DNA-binding SARP family transcriptional activator
MAVELDIRLLGGFLLRIDSAPRPPLRTARAQALLAYLILHRDVPQPRQHVAFLFWPDSSEHQARTNLRQALFSLRQALPGIDGLIAIDHQTLQWRPSVPCRVDVIEFDRALARAHDAARARDLACERDALQQAAELYRGDLLPTCYDDWIVPERERLHAQCVHALRRLVELLEAAREYEAALQHAERWARMEPLEEDARAALMRLYTLKGDRPAALRVYHDFAARLQRELGIAPDRALRDQAARLKAAEARPPAQAAERGRERSDLLPLVGRTREWHALLEAWRRAASGNPHLALILGEAGIGKSRLAEELLGYLSRQGIATARSRAYAAEGRLSFAPITDWLRSPTVCDAIDRLERPWLTEVARLLPELLSQHPDLPPPSPLTEYWQRRRFFEALARAALAGGGPLLLLLDDMQWCDTETLEWLRFLMHFDPRARLLVVATARSEELTPEHPASTLIDALRSDDQLTDISLGPLDAAETAKIAEHLIGRALEVTQATRLYQETEGNPLFVVEMMRFGSIAGDLMASPTSSGTVAALGSPILPPKIYSVISHRLAQLSADARALAELAATVGRAFTTDVLASASDLSEDAFDRALDELWRRRIVREASGSSHTLAYDFSHDKIRDVAYAEVSPAQRRRLHRRAAQALEQVNPHDLDAVSAQIATHYDKAGMAAQAVEFYRRAAGVAQRVYAYEDAIALLRRGLSLVHQIPDPHARAVQELQLQLDLASPIRITQGWASPMLELPLERAAELSAQVGDADRQARAQVNLAFFYIVRAEFARARELNERLLSRLRSPDADAYIVMARANKVGWLLMQTGDWEAAEAEYWRAREAYDESQHATHIALVGADLGVLNIALASHALWFRGLADQALQRGQEALALANRLAHPFSQALALSYLATQYVFRREVEPTLAYATQAYDLAERYNVAYYRAWSDVLIRWAMAKCAPDRAMAARIQQALDDFHATGGRLRLPLYLSLLAECLDDSGATEAALAALDEAFECSERFDERWLDAELYRLRGELLLRHSANLAEAEACLNKALAIARERRTPPLELRAALALARLNRRNSALVETALTRFSEGFDQPDVHAAWALLRR